MNHFIENNSNNTVFSYKNKTYFTRFLIVYFFTLRKSFSLLWHYKIRKKFSSKETFQTKEAILFTKLGEDSKKIFLKLGGVYIKLGQFVSNMGHVLPDTFIQTLSDLQDRIPAHSFEEIKVRFYSETGKHIEEVFPTIQTKPIAAASTAQVYKAKLDEEDVVIKILYPGIEKLVEKDLQTVLFVMKRINRYLFNFEYKLIHAEIKAVITKEMDLKEEAKSLEKMTLLFEDYKEDYVFPKVYKDYSFKGILVTKFIEGVKISETKMIHKKTEGRSRPLELLIRAYMLMVFKFRFYHADPHSGNLIYTPDNKLCFIDFGAVNSVNDITAFSLKKIISSAISKDYYGVVDGMQEMGFFENNVDKMQLEKIAKFALEKFERFIKNVDYFKNISLEQINPDEAFVFLKGINSSLSDLLKIARVPQNYVMLERTLSLLMGNIANLDPYRNIFDYSDKYFKQLVIGEVSIVEKIISEEGQEILATSLQVPRELHKALLAINRGRLEINNIDTEKQTIKMYALGHQLIYTLFTISFIYFGNHFLFNNMNYLPAIFYTFSSCSLFLLVKSILKNKK